MKDILICFWRASERFISLRRHMRGIWEAYISLRKHMRGISHWADIWEASGRHISLRRRLRDIWEAYLIEETSERHLRSTSHWTKYLPKTIKLAKYMSNISRDVIFSEQKNPAGTLHNLSKGLTNWKQKRKWRKWHDVNYVNDLNQRKLDSCLSKISSHDLPYIYIWTELCTRYLDTMTHHLHHLQSLESPL
jgi:hypothetical protein